LFENSDEAYVVCRRDGEIEVINRKAAGLLNVPWPINGSRANLFKALPEPAAQRMRFLTNRPVSRSEGLDTVRLEAGNQLQHLVDFQMTPLEAGRFLFTIRDASRRHRLESHAQRLITAVDATPDAFFLTDAHLNISFVNPAFNQHTGYNIEETLGQKADFLRAPSEAGHVAEYLQAVNDGREWKGVLINLRKDGTTYSVETAISPIYDKDGVFLGYVACERDITAKQQLQHELCFERDFAQSIINSLEAAVYTVDCNFRLTHANDGWKRLGAEHGGMVVKDAPRLGTVIFDYLPDLAKKEGLQKLCRLVLESGQSHEMNLAAGHDQHWQVRISPRYADKKISGLILHITDQSKLHDLQKQLYQAQKMEILGTLASGVAHDFNNLLQAIRGNVSLVLLESQVPEAFRQRLEQIDRAACAASEISQQLLTFSRATDERVAVLDFNQIIREATQLARRSFRGNVQVELKFTAQPAKVKIDATRASQLLLNLCLNAQDAMPDGGSLSVINRIVKLTEMQTAKTGSPLNADFLLCSVVDTGKGISPKVLPHIFDAFFTTKEKGKGTGLGLSIAQRVANEAGGFIEVESQMGIGTAFHIYLPVAHEALTSDKKPEKTKLACGTGRLLVVDDMDLVRDFTESFLRRAGYQVKSACDALKALELLEKEKVPFDLVLTDYDMPGMSGMELIEEIRGRWPTIKFVLVSGFMEDAFRKRSQEMGVKLLNKPFTIQQAVGTINELLESERK
jgi:PAS domain S-box-containing protein